MKIKGLLAVFLAMLVYRPLPGEPVGLTEVYQQAMGYDANYRAALASFAAQREEIGKARAGFRPTLRVSAARGRNATESTSLITDQSREYFYNTQSYSVQIKQPLFNLASFEQYAQAKAIAAKSEALLQREESALAARSVEAYLNVLFSEDNLTFSRAQVDAAREQLGQAKKRFESGYGTITEINEAQAHYDMVLAEGIEYHNQLENSRRAFENITGVYPGELMKLEPNKMVLVMLEPHDVAWWVASGIEQNSGVDAARQEIRIAEKQLDKQRAARYPVFDLVGSRSFSESDNNYSIGTQYDTYGVSLQMSMPLYTGGYVSASVRQASAQVREANEKMSHEERTISAKIRKHFNGILSSLAQIRAFEQAVKSGEIAFIGTKKGYIAGLRSNVDVLAAQEKLFESRRNLARSRYQFIMNRIMLKDAAGLLSASDIEEVNGWLR